MAFEAFITYVGHVNHVVLSFGNMVLFWECHVSRQFYPDNAPQQRWRKQRSRALSCRIQMVSFSHVQERSKFASVMSNI